MRLKYLRDFHTLLLGVQYSTTSVEVVQTMSVKVTGAFAFPLLRHYSTNIPVHVRDDVCCVLILIVS